MRLVLFAGIGVVALACSGEPTAPPPGTIDLAADWRKTTPAAVGLDGADLHRALSHAAVVPRLLSLLVVRHGRLAVEAYFNGNDADSLNDVRSVTKSVVSTLAGIAVNSGDLRVDAPIGGLLTGWSGHPSGEWSSVTIQDLLTMSGGFSWDELNGLGDYNAWVTSDDPVAYLLDRPIIDEPGTTFRYNSAGAHVLAVAVERATGMPIDELAAAQLLPRLGIERVRWERIGTDRRPNGGSGLDLRPRDMAKLGWLWLQQGDAGRGRVLHPRWIEEGSAPAFEWWQTDPPLADQNYGWLWWLARSPGHAAFFAWGWGGQFIWVEPELDLVIVVTTAWRGIDREAAERASADGLDLIVNYLIPAVH